MQVVKDRMEFSVVTADRASERVLETYCNCFGLNFYFTVFFRFHSSINTNSVMVVKLDVTEKTVSVSSDFQKRCNFVRVYMCDCLQGIVWLCMSLFDVFTCSVFESMCVSCSVLVSYLCVYLYNVDIYMSVCN